MTTSIQPMPLLQPTKATLDNLLFGSTAQSSDIDRWHHAGFVFDANVTFGLIQSHGGPCGVLAPVQAYIIHNLLFVQNLQGDSSAQIPLSITADQQRHTLITVLIDMLKRSSTTDSITVVLGTSLTELQSYTHTDTKQLYSLLSEHYTDLQSDLGIMLFVYSLLLTHTVQQTRDDMDDNTQPLVARFAHTTQELVNLCVTGHAVSNVFNGVKTLDEAGLKLKGIDKSYEIGYLTLLESMRYSEVGSYYKQPLSPVYVIASESHYTVMFGLDKSIGQQTPQQRVISQYKQLFDQPDAQANGFISAEQVPALLQSYGIAHITAEAAVKQTDPDGLGVVLWQNMLTALKQWIPSKFTTPPSTEPFVCSACTYQNTGSRTVCEVCETVRPAPVAQPQTDSRRFTLYHYNGLQQNDAKTGTKSTQCIRVNISLTDLDSQQAGQQTDGRSLIDVIQTRWINAIVGYDTSVEPKII